MRPLVLETLSRNDTQNWSFTPIFLLLQLVNSSVEGTLIAAEARALFIPIQLSLAIQLSHRLIDV